MLLTDDQAKLRDLARGFAAKEVSPHALQWDFDEHVPLDTFAMMGELGFMGMLTPPEWDGVGVDFVTYALVC